MAEPAKLVGTSSSQRTLDQRELASLRPARENQPRPRKPRVLREVTAGIVCFCGERFGESEALDFMLHLRAEVGEQLDTLGHRVVQQRDYQKRRYAEDEEYRERIKAQKRAQSKRKRANPEWRDAANARRRERIRLNGRADRISQICACGCGSMTKGGQFKRGHHPKRKVWVSSPSGLILPVGDSDG